MHVLITGANGSVGRFIVKRLLDDGHAVTVLGRRPLEDWPVDFIGYDLAEKSLQLPEADALVHCALQHVPGKFRGGEGDDPHGFIRQNVEGTQLLFEVAKETGIKHCVFLSSRAVYTDTGNWTVLGEVAETQPGTLYGQAKLAGEEAMKTLVETEFLGSVLRATGVYGLPPGKREHKWSGLFQRFENGKEIAPRLGTEVHGDDLADAVSLLLQKRPFTGSLFEVYNVSDLLLDRQDLLSRYARLKNITAPVPQRADEALGVMDTGKLKVLGWNPGGDRRLQDFLESQCAEGER
ncbi:MAG: SDR family oxidoreductase [Roseibium sp.]|uniref:NAD-dependent epimerase/dehydratase family protein n=1 Tax=Roseibium sp. TaxID=1936156 RepID=UPI00262BB655|nr:SDR family oxidoreductase [Roseibium sp.]MCV0429302.1 SDR family oxidoreductase [Roseibium sp.]